MPQDAPGESRLHAILHRRAEVFGPSADALVREIEARIGPAERPDFVELIETWPMQADGTPGDGDALYHRLTALRALPAALPAGVKAGSAAAGVMGLVLGAVTGLPLGFVAYMVVREVLLPTSLWSSDGVMWGVIGLVVALGGGIGLKNGAAPSRGGRAAVRGLIGFLLGALGGGFAGGAIALTLGELLGVSQMEGAFAMGVAFGVMPLSALLGGACLAFWMGRRAWRSWGRSAQ